MEHYPQLNLPLQGLTVAITSSRRASELGHVVEALGARPYFSPTVGIEAAEKTSVADCLNLLLSIEDGSVYIAIFITGVGTESVFLAAEELGLKDKLIERLRSVPLIIARSTKPSSTLAKYGIKENVKVAPEANFQGIIQVLDGYDLGGRKVVIFWHGGRSNYLVDSIKNLGANVFEFSTYFYSTGLNTQGRILLKSAGFGKSMSPERERISELIRDLLADKIDAIMFTSPPAVENLFNVAQTESKQDQLRLKLTHDVVTVSIGPSTSETLDSCGVKADVVPDVYKMGKMVESLVSYLKNCENAKRKKLLSSLL